MLASALYFTTCFLSPKPPLTPRMLDYYILLRVFMCCFPVLRKMFRIFRHKLEQEEENWQFSEISNSSSIFYPPTVCAARQREAEFLNYANHKYLRPSEATNSNTATNYCVLCATLSLDSEENDSQTFFRGSPFFARLYWGIRMAVCTNKWNLIKCWYDEASTWELARETASWSSGNVSRA